MRKNYGDLFSKLVKGVLQLKIIKKYILFYLIFQMYILIYIWKKMFRQNYYKI